MPTYQYACTECGHAFERFQGFSDDALTLCPVCEGKLRKVYNAVGVVFKGSGFYRNDSRTDGRGGSKGEGAAASAGDTSGSEVSAGAGTATKESTGGDKSADKSGSGGGSTGGDKAPATSGSSAGSSSSGSGSSGGSTSAA